MQRARLGQHEFRNRHFEAVAILGHAEVFAAHRTLGGAELGAAGVLELFARLEQRLVADHAQPTAIPSTHRSRCAPMTTDELSYLSQNEKR